MKAYHKEKIWFRVVGFPENLLSALRRTLPGTHLETGTQKKTGELVVSIRLHQKINYRKLRMFLRKNGIASGKYGLWISLVTERDSDGVRVPNFAVKFLQQTGGKLDFSFTAVGNQCHEKTPPN
jgi:hypothetical protein